MTEYHNSASESVVRCGIAPEGWKLPRSSDKSWRFQITVHHTKTFGTQGTSLKIGIASQVSDGRHSLVVAVAVTLISLLLMWMQVRFLCLLEDSFSTQMSTRKASLSNDLVIPGLRWIYVNDSVMHFRSFSRKRNINTLVTVTVTVTGYGVVLRVISK